VSILKLTWCSPTSSCPNFQAGNGQQNFGDATRDEGDIYDRYGDDNPPTHQVKRFGVLEKPFTIPDC